MRKRFSLIAVLLRDSRYRRYLLARWINVLGSTVAPLGLAFSVLKDGGGAGALSVVLVAGPLAALLVTPLAGVAGDRFSRTAVMTCCQAASGAAQMASGLLVVAGHAPAYALATLVLVTGSAGAFLQPAMQGLLPMFVEESQLTAANGAVQAASNLVAVLGPALAGVVIALIGPGWVLVWDSVTFFVSAIMFARLRIPSAARATRTGAGADLREGMRAFASHRWLVDLAFLSAASFGCWTIAITVLGPVIARQDLRGAVGWGIVNSALGVGLAIGTITSLLIVLRRTGLIMCVSVLPSAVLMACLAAAQPLAIVAAAAVATGAASTIQVISWASFLQKTLPAAQFARVSSTYTMVAKAPVPIAYLLAGPLTGLLGIHAVLWGCAVVTAGSGAAASAIRDVRQLGGLRAESVSVT